jgi:hypothetical protein
MSSLSFRIMDNGLNPNKLPVKEGVKFNPERFANTEPSGLLSFTMLT